MKYLRILLAFSLSAIACASLVRAEDKPVSKESPSSGGCCKKKKDPAQCEPSQSCPVDSKTEKKEATKAP